MDRHPRRLAASLPIFLPLLALSSLAEAAKVVRIEAPGPDGRWREVATSGEARIQADSGPQPLSVGGSLSPGQRLEVDEARVIVELEPGELVVIGQGSRITWGERSLIEEAGSLYLRVRSVFEVDFGSGEATVEGTRFGVAQGPAGTTVRVEEGRVRVSAAGASVRLGPGQSTSVPPAGPPAPAERRPPDRDTQKLAESSARSSRMGIAVVAGGRPSDGWPAAPAAFARVNPYLSLPGPFVAGLDLAAVQGGGLLHLEPGVSGGLDLGRFQVLGEIHTALGPLEVDGQDQGVVAIPAGGARLRTFLPVGARFRGLIEVGGALGGRPGLGLPAQGQLELSLGGAFVR